MTAEPVNGERRVQMLLIIESTPSIPELDSNNAFKVDDKGKILYCPDETQWRPVIPADVPEWVRESENIQAMVNHQAINYAASDGGLWFRARQADLEEMNKANIDLTLTKAVH